MTAQSEQRSENGEGVNRKNAKSHVDRRSPLIKEGEKAPLPLPRKRGETPLSFSTMNGRNAPEKHDEHTITANVGKRGHLFSFYVGRARDSCFHLFPLKFAFLRAFSHVSLSPTSFSSPFAQRAVIFAFSFAS